MSFIVSISNTNPPPKSAHPQRPYQLEKASLNLKPPPVPTRVLREPLSRLQRLRRSGLPIENRHHPLRPFRRHYRLREGHASPPILRFKIILLPKNNLRRNRPRNPPPPLHSWRLRRRHRESFRRKSRSGSERRAEDCVL